MSMYETSRGFTRDDTGSLKIRKEDLEVFKNMVTFFLHPAQTKAEFIYEVGILLGTFESAMKAKGTEFVSVTECNSCPLNIEVTGLAHYFDKK